MASPTQKIQPPTRGQRVTAAREQASMVQNQRRIVGGKGIVVRPMADQIVVEAVATPSGTPSGGGITVYKEPSAAQLPANVAAHSLGFITDGVEKGAWYERTVENDGWQGRTIWHTS